MVILFAEPGSEGMNILFETKLVPIETLEGSGMD